MTTIILTIIGILLAAAAALMVIFYGGDAFNGGSIGAQANTYQNSGTNVVSAIELARASNATWTTDPTSLHSGTDPDLDFLKEVPTVPGGGTGSLVLPADHATNVTELYQYTATVGGDNAAAVCSRINKNLKLATPDAVTVSSGIKMGCDNTSKTFFANA